MSAAPSLPPTPIASPKTEIELLREIAETTARMLADEHAGFQLGREREKAALYPLLIEWRRLPRPTVPR